MLSLITLSNRLEHNFYHLAVIAIYKIDLSNRVIGMVCRLESQDMRRQATAKI